MRAVVDTCTKRVAGNTIALLSFLSPFSADTYVIPIIGQSVLPVFQSSPLFRTSITDSNDIADRQRLGVLVTPDLLLKPRLYPGNYVNSDYFRVNSYLRDFKNLSIDAVNKVTQEVIYIQFPKL